MSERKKLCRCSASLRPDGTCVFRCPPPAKRRVDNRTSRPRTLASRKASPLLCAALFLLSSIRTAGADSNALEACVCVPPPANGSRPNESLEQRAARQETERRLTAAELAVARRRNAPRR